MSRKPVKKSVFVCVESPDSGERRTTRMDSEGGSQRTWNEKVEMEVAVHARFITAEVKEKSGMGGIRSVGVARIPVSDFMGSYVPENEVQFLSYRLWDRKCRRSGVLNVKVRVKGAEAEGCCAVKGVPVGDGGSSGVVCGIPVWLNQNHYPPRI